MCKIVLGITAPNVAKILTADVKVLDIDFVIVTVRFTALVNVLLTVFDTLPETATPAVNIFVYTLPRIVSARTETDACNVLVVDLMLLAPI